MSKTETLRQSAAALNATRVEHLATQIESLRQAKHQSGVLRPNPRNFQIAKSADGLCPINPRQNSLQVNRIALVSEGVVPQEMQVLPSCR